METAAELPSLSKRREEKIMIQHEKLQRMPSHPAHQQMQEATKNRLKRKSFLHLAKELDISTKLNLKETKRETLIDIEEWDTKSHEIKFAEEITGIPKKAEMTDEELKSRTLKMLEGTYNPLEWVHAYTDGSADGAVRNGGSGVYVRFPNKRSLSTSIPV